MRKTLQAVSDPTPEQIVEGLKELGIQRTPNLEWTKDLFQCLSQSAPKQVLSKPSTWQCDKMTRELLKMEQQLLLELVKNDDRLDETPLKRALLIQFKLFDYLQSSGKTLYELRPTNGTPPTLKIRELVKRIEQGVEEIEKIRATEDKDVIELLGIPEDYYPEQVLSKLTKDQRKMLDIISQVNEINALKVGSYPTQIEDETSKRKKELLITEFEQISKVSIGQQIGPLHPYKLATKQYSLEQGVKTIESKQILVLLIDDSSSMNTPAKQMWVKAIILNRVKSVIEGRSELYAAWFINDIYRIQKISTREEAKRFYTEYKYNGVPYGTDIGKVLQIVSLSLLNRKFGEYEIESKYQPHILIVNDGQDYVDSKFTIVGIVHAFVLGDTNLGLKAVVNRSNGHYQHVPL